MIGWNFPSNGGGAINGVADSGIEIFRGKEIPSLAREICQNSLDAAIDENSAVTVEFQRHKISPKDIPDVRDYEKFLRACQSFWKGNSKTETFIKKANDELKNFQTAVLRISDFNTTGLAEPFNPRSMTGWNTLTKINGGAIKSDDKAGNFGIGKNAPFANSFFRLIFYRTLNTKGERAAQAVAKLVSFNLDAENISAGMGYYGDTQGNIPVQKITALDNISQRTQTGTDVFVYGFNGGDVWQDELITALIENFLVAIYRDKLRVKVQGKEINKETLGAFVKEDAANYHKILTGDDSIKIFEFPFHDMGKLKLSVLTDSTTVFNRRVLIVRKSGMKLFELDHFSRTLNFTGILELEGFKLNAFFREMETPEHTKWEPTRHPTKPKLAKAYFDELKRLVRNEIANLVEVNISDETDVKGLGEMLDFDNDAIDFGGNSKSVETFDTPAMPENFTQEISLTVDNSKSTLTKTGGDDNSKTQRTSGDVTDTGGLPSIRTLKGQRERNRRDIHTGEENPDGDDLILKPDGRKIACNKIRVIKLGEKIYRLILKVPHDVPSGRIEISAVGESNTGEKLSVAQAASADSSLQITSAGDAIAFQKLRGNLDARITFELQEDKNYALGVAVHED